MSFWTWFSILFVLAVSVYASYQPKRSKKLQRRDFHCDMLSQK